MKAIILALVLMNVGFAKKFSTSQIVNAFANSELVTSFVEDIEHQHDVKCKTSTSFDLGSFRKDFLPS
jgi:hypothetical protein